MKHRADRVNDWSVGARARMRFSRSSVVSCGLALGAMPLLIAATREFQAKSGFYGPRAELRYRKPTLRWEVWSDAAPVTAANMEVNGQAVDAHYDSQSRSL